MTRGGKRKGAGAPLKDPSERKDVIVRVRVTADEWRRVQAIREDFLDRGAKDSRYLLVLALRQVIDAPTG